MRLAVIPARGGSKRVPRKNIRSFAGKPMIGYAIGAALGSDLFDHVVVSTDDDEIATIALQLGAEVPFRRPVDLADDHTPTVEVIAHAVRTCEDLGWAAGAICCIYPGVPMIEPGDIARALDLLSSQPGMAYAFPVVPFSSAIQRALRRRPDGTTSPLFPEYQQIRTQDLEPAFHDAGQFYWGRRDAWLEGLSIHGNGTTIVLPEWRVVDIDTEDDWVHAEALHRALQQEARA